SLPRSHLLNLLKFVQRGSTGRALDPKFMVARKITDCAKSSSQVRKSSYDIGHGVRDVTSTDQEIAGEFLRGKLREPSPIFAVVNVQIGNGEHSHCEDVFSRLIFSSFLFPSAAVRQSS